MPEIEDALAAVKGRWMTGMEAAPAAPASWKPLLDGKDDAELRLLALAGQVTRVAMRPVPPEALVPPPLLPTLALPTMPEGARVRFRQVMANARNDAEPVRRALALAAARGYAAHPADWMPGKTDGAAPALYAPWVDWQNADGERGTADVLDETTWEAWYPSERRAALARMRSTDPAAARALLAAKAGDVPAEERVRLVGLLADGLSEEDADLLAELGKDRSGKVKVLAALLLARLGRGAADADEVAELAATLEIAGGILRRKALSPVKLKNDAQRRRRDELFARVPLAALAQAMDLSPKKAVALWDIVREGRATRAFAETVAASGADGLPGEMMWRLIEENHATLAPDALVERLSPEERAAMLPECIARDDGQFTLTLAMAGDELGTQSHDTLDASGAMSSLLAALAASLAKDAEDWRTEAVLAGSLRAVGLLAKPKAAAKLLERFTGMGLISADPRLDMLHLNAALPKRTDP